MKGVRALKKIVPVFKVSCKTGEGFEEVILWIMEKVKTKQK
jgi:hydrogenase nickel incorporation protein HypB